MRTGFKVFPFNFTDIAKLLFLSLPSCSVHSCNEMQKCFLKKFYPSKKASQVCRELSVIKQGPNESTYDYLERFNALEQKCCSLGITERRLVEYLLDGLMPLERLTLDSAAGDTLLNLTLRQVTLRQVREQIREITESARFKEKTTRRDETGRTMNVSQVECNNNQLTNDLKELKEIMQKMLVAHVHGIEVCEL